MTRWMSLWSVLLLLAACTDGGTAADERLVVFAAASLTEAMNELADEFERRRPGTDLVINLAGSNQLALQIEQHAPADVYISANPQWMDYLVQRDLVEQPIAIARNTVVIATPETNPAGLDTWTDLARPGTLVVTAAPEVPAGRYADSVLADLDRRADAPNGYAAAVRDNVVSQEESVKGAVAKLLLGEADAGFVYRTDATERNGLRIIPLPDGTGQTEDYLMAGTRRTTSPATQEFLAFMQSEAARSVLARWGFQPPTLDQS